MIEDSDLVPDYFDLSKKQLKKIDFNKLRMKYEQKLPPSQRDLISPETLAMFDNFGKIGWKFVSD